MYRIMLYCKLFPVDHDSGEDLDADTLSKIRAQRTAVLREYPTDELQQLHSAVNFMRPIFDAVSSSRTRSALPALLPVSLDAYPQ